MSRRRETFSLYPARASPGAQQERGPVPERQSDAGIGHTGAGDGGDRRLQVEAVASLGRFGRFCGVPSYAEGKKRSEIGFG